MYQLQLTNSLVITMNMGDISTLCQLGYSASSHLLSLTEAAVFSALRPIVSHSLLSFLFTKTLLSEAKKMHVTVL